jgi:cell division control protein 6
MDNEQVSSLPREEAIVVSGGEKEEVCAGGDIVPITPIISRANIKRKRRRRSSSSIDGKQGQQHASPVAKKEEEEEEHQDLEGDNIIPVISRKKKIKKPLLQQQQQKPEQQQKELPRKLSDYIIQLEEARKTVSRSFLVESLAKRDKETNFIKEKIEASIKNHIGTSIILSGQPGTGKTACVDLLIQYSFKSIKTLKINCMGYSRSNFLKEIAAFFDCDEEDSSIISEKRNIIFQKINKLGKPHLIVLDEIESVPDKGMLNNLLKAKNKPLIIIGITNDVNDISSWKQNFEFQLSFSPYSKEQMKDILTARLINFQHLFSKPVLEFISSRTFDGGSARTSLDITEAAISSLLLELKEILNRDGDMEPANPYQVQLKHVQNHIKSSLTNSTKIESISSLPAAQKVLLCAAFKLLRQDRKDFTIGDLVSFYVKLQEDEVLRTMVQKLNSQQILAFCESLQNAGLVSIIIPSARGGIKRITPKCKVSIDLAESDMEAALGKFSWFKLINNMK